MLFKNEALSMPTGNAIYQQVGQLKHLIALVLLDTGF